MRNDNILNLQTSSNWRCLRVTLLLFMILSFVATPTPLRAENDNGGRIVIPRLKVNLGTNQRLAVQLNNSEEFTAFQAEITFPEGITPAKTNNGNYSVSLSDRKVDHTISGNIISSGALKVAAFSMNNESLKDKSGDLFFIDITSDASFTGPATIEVKGILFTRTKDRKELAFPDVSVIADINYAAGDANTDGFVNAADIVEIVNYIKGSPSEKFNEEAADADGNKTIDAADIETIKSIIMGK